MQYTSTTIPAFARLVCLLLLVLLTTACKTQHVQQAIDTPAIDPSKAVAVADSDLLWFDALDIGVEGQGWKEVKLPYDRLPADAEGVVRGEVWGLSHDSAGLSVSFITDSPVIAARWSLNSSGLSMHHMPSTGDSGVDLYAKDAAGQYRWVGAGRPKQQDDSEWTLIKKAPEGTHEYRLYLPLYNGIKQLQIGVAKDSRLAEPVPYDAGHEKPILFWGTSILQGGCASRPGMAYPSIIGRRMNRPTINLGFSGNGQMDPEIVDMIAKLDVAAYVIDCGPNMSPDMITQRTIPLVTKLREAHPDTPIVIVENVPYQNAWFVQSMRESYQSSNARLKEAYKQLRKDGVRELYYVPCDDLYGHDSEATVDGVHATDLGFLRLADGVEPTLRKALK